MAGTLSAPWIFARTVTCNDFRLQYTISPRAMNEDGPIRLSAVIITLNAAKTLSACLESVRFADEIVVVDSGSEDTTLDIARQFDAKVMNEPWRGFGAQKNFAVSQASHDWVLCIDADEQVSEQLRQSITTELKAPRHRAYEMARCNRFLGRWLRHGEGYPDWNTRLFERRHAWWSDDSVHEHVVAQLPIGRLVGDLMHESQDTLASYLEKQNRYTTLQAERLFAAGNRAHLGHLLLSPAFRFMRMTLFRLGFLDGIPGIVHIGIGCMNSFAKYAKLLELQCRATE